MSEKSCPCPPFDREAWEGREVAWRARPFFRQRMALVFGVPVEIQGYIRSTLAAIRHEGLHLADPYTVVERDRNPFQGDLLVAVEDPGRDVESVVRISGRFLAHVHIGSYSQLGRARKALVERIRLERGVKPAEVLYWYANCSACWDAAGGPATVILARIGAPPPEAEDPPPSAPAP